MPIQALGHAVLNVRNLDRSIEFYNGVLGLPVAARANDFGMAFFTLGNHHDFAVRAVGDQAPTPDGMGSVGLFHVAFKVGDSLDELRSWKNDLEAKGVKIEMVADHNVTASLYFHDPDGNGLELYVDTSDVWKGESGLVASMKPLQL